MLKDPGEGDGIDINDFLSSWKLPRSRSGAVIDADSLVIELPPSLMTDPGPRSKPEGDFAKNLDDVRLPPSLLLISLGSI